MDELKQTDEMNVEELINELTTPKHYKKTRRLNHKDKKHSRKHLEEYLKAFYLLHK